MNQHSVPCEGSISASTPANSPEPHALSREGGLGCIAGLQVAGISAGFRRNPARKDLALIVAKPSSVAAGVFTQNSFAAAPVHVSREHLAAQATAEGFRALVINSGNANATTGAPGLEAARATSRLVAKAVGCNAEQVLVASTGVIGVPLDCSPFETGIPEALAALGSADGLDAAAGLAAAEAIMTTDTHPKMAVRSFALGGGSPGAPSVPTQTYTVAGMAKGSGMIAPHMATMIAVLATDCLLTGEALQQALQQAVGVSFNKLTIDSDTSTNDSCYLIATGGTPGPTLTASSPGFAPFVQALTEVCTDLTYQMAQDGEGATKVVVVDVAGAASEEDADAAARAIADSPLVKTAIAGHDANWGRIAMALGKSGANFNASEVSITLLGLPMLQGGLPVPFSEQEALQRFEACDEVFIEVNLGAGTAATRIWTCDLTHGYIEINGDYRT